jgi:hypothetical protein
LGTWGLGTNLTILKGSQTNMLKEVHECIELRVDSPQIISLIRSIYVTNIDGTKILSTFPDLNNRFNNIAGSYEMNVASSLFDKIEYNPIEMTFIKLLCK